MTEEEKTANTQRDAIARMEGALYAIRDMSAKTVTIEDYENLKRFIDGTTRDALRLGHAHDR